MPFEYSLNYAKSQDEIDPLKDFRKQFYIPILNDKPAIYLTGNSLGLQPKTAQNYILNELEDWATFGVEGHFHARNPWFSYHEILNESAAKIVGALPSEVVVMNQLTVNLHLLMVSFYQPTNTRFKIICEANAFPSDQYALESQVKLHGFNPEEAIIEIAPRPGEHCIHHSDIIDAINLHKNDLALVLIGGVNYLTGQVFDMENITKAAHQVGAYVGFDLAHAAGNIQLKLHHWQVDFACWCSYKYLNSGPGGVAGAFVHENHHGKNLPQFAGWWGHDKATRFQMKKGFIPIKSAEAWQLSNAPIFSMAVHKSALEIFEQAGMDKLLAKSNLLTAYMAFVIEHINQQLTAANNGEPLQIITPEPQLETGFSHRGCQLSIVAHGRGKDLYEKLVAHGIIADWREPNVIRVAPVPLYNSFEDVYNFGAILLHLLLH
jgi:kynureninase